MTIKQRAINNSKKTLDAYLNLTSPEILPQNRLHRQNYNLQGEKVEALETLRSYLEIQTNLLPCLGHYIIPSSKLKWCTRKKSHSISLHFEFFD